MEENKTPVPTGERDRAHLEMAGKWAKFIAIVYFIYIGLATVAMLFLLLVSGAAGASVPGMPASFGPAFMTWYFICLIVVLAIMIIPTLYLYRFGVNALAAARGGDEEAMSHSLTNLGRLFRFIGIYIIAMFALCVVVFIAVIVAGTLAGLGAAAAGAM